ncbi:MAG: hypothetical protein ABIP50_01565 [Candidatus Saccharimonadales bacterium]
MELLIFFLGIATSLLSYIGYNFLLKPIISLNEFKAKIGHTLTYYSHIITSPGRGKLADEASPIIRDLAFELEEKYLLVPLNKLATFFRLIPARNSVVTVKGQIIFMSNSVSADGKTDQNHKALEEVFTLLNIKELEPRNNNKK